MRPTYVQYGAADLGIAGQDVLAEHGGAGLYQPLDLGIAACRMVVAVRKGFDYEGGGAPGRSPADRDEIRAIDARALRRRKACTST
jgi:ATP phosphoribosyltransferase